MLRARVGRAIEELRVFVQSAGNPLRSQIDVEVLRARLEAIRSAQTDRDA
jgi:hypothetical protein